MLPKADLLKENISILREFVNLKGCFSKEFLKSAFLSLLKRQIQIIRAAQGVELFNYGEIERKVCMLRDISKLVYKLDPQNRKRFVISFYNIFFRKIYEIPEFSIKNGHIALDIGGYLGDSAYYFSKKVGKRGKVYVFEPVNEFCQIIESMDLKNCAVVQKGIGTHSFKDRILIPYDKPDGAHRNSSLGTITSEFTSIDRWFLENGIENVNLIKIDIEGDEMNALIGGKTTINRFKPTVIVSVYHKPSDFYSIPLYIRKNYPFYELRMSHKSIHYNDTCLFAYVPSENH